MPQREARYWCLKPATPDEVACRNISMVEVVVGWCLDEAYLGISADVLIRPATAVPVDPRGTVQRWLNSMTVRSAGSISSGSSARITTSTAVPSGRPRRWRSFDGRDPGGDLGARALADYGDIGGWLADECADAPGSDDQAFAAQRRQRITDGIPAHAVHLRQ